MAVDFGGSTSPSSVQSISVKLFGFRDLKRKETLNSSREQASDVISLFRAQPRSIMFCILMPWDCDLDAGVIATNSPHSQHKVNI